ncbi:hypothetical protein K470DRAFT_272840 [Piedraia hortae CBS 480.64]|uniref:TATA element modulatory factor 1 TATA binding domain-containing protein n=1 Tax=Piedraia hortae CBS 480.64 TaxID=1314780 RepID=A0A6A7BRT1_9PEZI|nr:hypothetical protein K470DRAFT_272840 [Piedraia hortae CBS 480.64]
MSSPSKGAKKGWGSLLSGAVANLESRLDTILAEDSEASARQRAAEAALKEAKKDQTSASRDASRGRTNETLAQRLARASAKKEDSSPYGRNGAGTAGIATEPVASEQGSSALADRKVSVNPARTSTDVTTPTVLEPTDGAESIGTKNAEESVTKLEDEVERLQLESTRNEQQWQEERLIYIEKVDALQSKLKYLTEETLAAAEGLGSGNGSGSDSRLAEKDKQIALLMQEGEKLSMAEMKHLQTIKRLKAKAATDGKAAATLEQKLERAEHAESVLKQKLGRAEGWEKRVEERGRQIAALEERVEGLRVERDAMSEQIGTLTRQLKEARAQSQTHDVDKVSELEEELGKARAGVEEARDRARSEIRRLNAELEQQQERSAAAESELKDQVSGLEARLEAMRVVAEEATSAGAGSEAQTKLLRQSETLMNQYSVAKANWETIEASLNARLSQMEAERDEAVQRETRVRKKAREVGMSKRKTDEELEAAEGKIRSLNRDLDGLREELDEVRKRLSRAESSAKEAKADAAKQRQLWEAEVDCRIEEERVKWRQLAQPRPPSASPLLCEGVERPRRLTTAMGRVTPSDRSPAMSRNVSAFGLSPSMSRETSSTWHQLPSIPGMPAAPSQEFDHDEGSAVGSSGRNPNDTTSTSMAQAGPSVQMMERLSAAVRRLEAEKANFGQEAARLARQRDEAREEVVRLLREAQTEKDESATKLKAELGQLRKRYDASLEMLGEKEEEVEDLKQDVKEMKRLYRELVDKVG